MAIPISGTITVGSSVTGARTDYNQQQWYAVTLVANITYTISERTSGNFSTPLVAVTNDANVAVNTLGTFYSNSGFYWFDGTFAPFASGTYYLSARDFYNASDGFGPYTLSVTSATTTTFPPEITGSVTVGSSTTGRIETQGDLDYFAVTLTAGATYDFRLNGHGTLSVYDSGGHLEGQGYQNAPPILSNAVVEYTAKTSGTYYLEVSGSSPSITSIGNYVVIATAVFPDDHAGSSSTDGTLNVNGYTLGSIEKLGDKDWFATTLTAGHTYKFLVSHQGDSVLNLNYPALYIYASNATSTSSPLATYNNLPGSNVAQITFTPTTTGRYFVDVEAQTGDTGFYTVTATDAGKVSAPYIWGDHQGITRTALTTNQAQTITDIINAGGETEADYVTTLLGLAINTTYPAVAVEASMYGATGISDEVTSLTTNFLPAQVANATKYGLNAQVYACEALGLVFAFGNENSNTAFSNNFGPSNSAMPNTTAGDASFASAASTAIFGSASTANLVNVMGGFVSFWKGFFTANGVPGGTTAAQIDLAARGTAWGDMVGVALANNLGPLNGQVVNLLDDAAQGSAVYGASLVGQPAHQPFQGA